MQFQVPQFSEAEDKVVGPLTLKQFIYIAVGAAIIMLLYVTLATWLWLLLSFIIAGTLVAFAFVKINGRPFEKFFLAAINYYWQPQTYSWQPENPHAEKSVSTMKAFTSGGLSLESIVSGIALKTAWRKVQLGSSEKAPAKTKQINEKYEVFRGLRGERKAARRVDYR